MPKKITNSKFHRGEPQPGLTRETLESNYALESGAEEMGISYDCTCQSFDKNHPQEEGREVGIYSVPGEPSQNWLH